MPTAFFIYKLLRKVAINITGESASNISGVYCNS